MREYVLKIPEDRTIQQILEIDADDNRVPELVCCALHYRSEGVLHRRLCIR